MTTATPRTPCRKSIDSLPWNVATAEIDSLPWNVATV